MIENIEDTENNQNEMPQKCRSCLKEGPDIDYQEYLFMCQDCSSMHMLEKSEENQSDEENEAKDLMINKTIF